MEPLEEDGLISPIPKRAYKGGVSPVVCLERSKEEVEAGASLFSE